MPLSPEREAEITDLANRYGVPRRLTVDVPTMFDPLNKTDRIGEVCMVVRRTDGRLVTARKEFYPPDGYRLLTGGIHHDEPIEGALLRETYEETGLDAVIRRFLAIIEYRLPITPPRSFYTFALLVDETGGTLEPQDENERLAGYLLIRPDELPAMAATLANVTSGSGNDPILDGRWHEWGIFRSIVHHVVYDVLHDKPATIQTWEDAAAVVPH
jgi:NAD+ diphosphatase